jgi:DNA-binding beta-propeller fold protein YncE
MKLTRLTPLLLSTASLIWNTSCSGPSAQADDSTEASNNIEAAYSAAPGGGDLTISKKWTMPAELLEISGISLMDDQRIACVQDERGSLFIYNLSTSRIEKEIPFAGTGDYEAVTKAGSHFYIMRSDGHIYEIDPAAKKPLVREFDAEFGKKHDIEAMSYDASQKRLLIADKTGGSDGTRDIYALDLATGKMNSKPVYQIDLTSLVVGADKGKGKKKGDKKKGDKKDDKKVANALQPSAMAINPRTGEIYITDGGESTLLILDRSGKTKRFIQLDKSDFPQPEGLTVSPNGEVYISSEGAKGDGIIARVTL